MALLSKTLDSTRLSPVDPVVCWTLWETDPVRTGLSFSARHQLLSSQKPKVKQRGRLIRMLKRPAAAGSPSVSLCAGVYTASDSGTRHDSHLCLLNVISHHGATRANKKLNMIRELCLVQSAVRLLLDLFSITCSQKYQENWQNLQISPRTKTKSADGR